MKNFKKLFLTLAVITMAIVCFAFGASARELTGQCGENVYWNYNDSTDKLIISGEGEMWNYDYFETPWHYSDVKSVIIEENVTTIGDCAFYNCRSLNSIIIPCSITSIGYDAFGYCYSIKNMTIPHSVTTIGCRAFYYCNNLTSIIIGNGVTTIPSSGFEHCTSLKSITIPDSVTIIGENAFKDCYNLKKIYSKDIESWLKIDFIDYTSNPLCYGAELYFGDQLVTEIVIPDIVTDIGKYVFYNCNTLTSVTINNSVSAIDDYAFAYCDSLMNVKVSDSVKTIGDYAFFDCSSLTSIAIPDSLTSIGNYTFSNCDSIEHIVIPNGMITMGEHIFDDCDALESLTIIARVENIGSYAFSDCKNLLSVTIYDDVTSLGKHVFDDHILIYCKKNSYVSSYAKQTNIKFVYLDGTDEESILGGKFGKFNWKLDKRTGLLELAGSGDMIDFTSFSAPWYEYKEYIASLKLPEGLTKIGSFAFKNLYMINEVKIPNSVKTIGVHAFNNCNRMLSVDFGESLTEIGACAFANCDSIKSINIPNSVKIIGGYAFENCKSLKKIYVNSYETLSKIDFLESGFDPLKIGAELYINNQLVIDFIVPANVENIIINSTSLKKIIFELDKYNQSKIVSVPTLNNTAIKDIILPASINNIYSNTFPATIEKVTVYNPNCEISASCGLGYTHTIIGFKGSTAEAFADEIGAEFIDIETVHTHSYKTVETVKATCKATGKTVGRCTCGKEKTTTLTKLAHKETTVKGKAATCTATGLTEGKKCSVCGTVTVAQKSIAKLAHKETTVKGTPATCTSTGLTDGKKCSVCGTVTVAQKTVAKKSHTYTTTTTKATLTKNGKVVKKCSVCGTVSSTSTIYYPKTITLSASSYTYNGKAKTPSVTVKDSKGKELKKDTDYTVKYESGRKSTGKYTVTVTFKGKYSGTKKLYFTITPKTTSKVTATQTTTSVTLKWSKVTGATGYRVFQRVNGKWKTLTNTTKLTYTIKKLNTGTNYTFAVRPYTVDGKDTILASTFTQLKTATKCKTPTLKVTSSKKGVASLSWTNVAGESGYQVYYSTQKDGEYKKVKSYKTDVVTASKSKLTSGKTYYFKIRAYKKTDSGTVYGAWSAVKSVKIK